MIRFDHSVLMLLFLPVTLFLVIYTPMRVLSLDEGFPSCVVLGTEGVLRPECWTPITDATMDDKIGHGHAQEEQEQQQQKEEATSCRLWLAPSTLKRGTESSVSLSPKLGLFAGIDQPSQTPLSDPDLEVLMKGANLNEWSLWHDITVPIQDEVLAASDWNDEETNHDQNKEISTRLFRSGMAALAACSATETHVNFDYYDDPRHEVATVLDDDNDENDINTRHSSKRVLPSDRQSIPMTRYAISAGQELIQPCAGRTDHEPDGKKEKASSLSPSSSMDHHSLQWLESNGICLDRLYVRPSTIPNAGLGAFAKQTVLAGEVIVTSPVVQFHQSQMEIVKQYRKDTGGEGDDRKRTIYYTEHVQGHQRLINYCLGHVNSSVLLLPYAPGVNYINSHHRQHHHHDPRQANAILDWSRSKYNTGRDVLSSIPTSEAIYHRGSSHNRLLVDYIALRDIQVGEEVLLDYGPDWQVAWDQHVEDPLNCNALLDDQQQQQEQQHHKLPSDFRHKIGIPTSMLPEKWLAADPKPMGDFILPNSTIAMTVGQIEPVRWLDTGDVVTPNAFVMKLSPRVRQVLVEYCDKLGITERFRDLTYRGNSLPVGQDENADFQGLRWYIQRPRDIYKSNMHWISPLERNAHDDYLRALSAAGFDQVLQQMGEYFGLDGLACYHVTFIAVSHCQRGYIHYDVTHTGNRVFNVLIPLILANDTGPELDIQAGTTGDASLPVGRLRYLHDVATLVGDDAYHGTSAVDYRLGKEMRMAATVYVADIRPDNIDSIVSDYTQKYPPPGRPDILMRMAGDHWKRSDPYAQLPRPFQEDFETYPLPPYKMSPLIWKRTQKPVSAFSHRVGLPFHFQREVVAYFTELGIIERCRSFFLQNGGESETTQNHVNGMIDKFGGFSWQLRRPPNGSHDSNILWITPGDAKAFDNVLNQLILLEFEGVLESIGEHFKLDGLVIYGLSLVAVCHTSEAYVQPKLSGTAGKAFNIVIPLTAVRKSQPEFDIWGHYDQPGRYRFEVDEGLVFGDDSQFETASIDYRSRGEYHLSLSMYVADINESNMRSMLIDYGQNYPPHGEEGAKLLLRWAGRHWTASNVPSQRWKKNLSWK
jgi:hypothetical protein